MAWYIFLNTTYKLYQTLRICIQVQFSQRYGQIKDKRPIFFLKIFLALHDPETRGVQELILSLFKIPSWLTYGWKSVSFWWYFHTFHENEEEVLLKIRLKTQTKTILEAVLFMYVLTNTNIVGIKFFSGPNMLLSCWLWTWSQQSLM